MSPNTVIVIPIYNHKDAIGNTVAHLAVHGLPILIVDDGSNAATQSVLAALAQQYAQQVTLIRLPANGGKGAAVMAGLRAAYAAGYTHALQIDADGQHEPEQAARFIDLARANPTAVIAGQATYDETVPKARKFGRWITHFWVWVETCSLDIADSMCGFRLYPLAATLKTLEAEHIGPRMQFDTEILVQLHWRRTPVINVPVQVVYPPGNTSNFRMLADNVRISLMHLGLILQMPVRMLVKLLRPSTRLTP